MRRKTLLITICIYQQGFIFKEQSIASTLTLKKKRKKKFLKSALHFGILLTDVNDKVYNK
jgi:hypothetical protein